MMMGEQRQCQGTTNEGNGVIGMAMAAAGEVGEAAGEWQWQQW